MDDLEHLEITTAGALWGWFAARHGQSDSIWCVSFKKHAADRHVSYDEIVDTAVAWGWIDSHIRKVDDARSKLLLSPRKPQSAWSAVNKARVARLEASGRMAAPGRAKIEAARQDGSWSFLDDVEALIQPPDLVDRLAHYASAATWEAFPRSVKRGQLEWIKTAKRAETRAQRIDAVARLAAEGRRANFER